MDALGLEEGDNSVDGMERSCVERRVLGQSSARIDAHNFKAEDFFFGLEGDACMGSLVEWVFMENVSGFGV